MEENNNVNIEVENPDVIKEEVITEEVPVPEVAEETKVDEVKKPKNKKIILFVGIVLVVIVCLIGLVLLLTSKDKKKDEDITSTTTTESTTTETTTVDTFKYYYNDKMYNTKKGTKFYVYVNRENDNSIYGYNILEEEDDEDRDKVGTYTCKNNGCNVYTVDCDYGKYILVYDHGYFIYDLKKQENVIQLKISRQIDTAYLYAESEDKVSAIDLLYADKKNVEYGAFYSVKENKMVYDFTKNVDYDADGTILSKNFVIKKTFLGKDRDYIESVKDFKYELIDLKTNKVVKNNIYSAITGKNVVYFYEAKGYFEEGLTITKLYDENFNEIYTHNSDDYFEYIVTDDDKLILEHDGQYFIYDKNYKLIKSSKKYYHIWKLTDNYFVGGLNNVVAIYDYDDRVVQKLADEYLDINGTSIEKESDGIHIRIYANLGDEIACDDVSDEEIVEAYKNYFGTDDEDAENVRTNCELEFNTIGKEMVFDYNINSKKFVKKTNYTLNRDDE